MKEISLGLKTVSRTKNGGLKRIVKEFQGKKSHVTVKRLIAKTRSTGSIENKIGSGRPRSASNEKNKSHVEELFQSQEDNPGTHKSLREIASDL